MWSSGVIVSWFSKLNLENNFIFLRLRSELKVRSTAYISNFSSSLLPSSKHGIEKSRSQIVNPALDDMFFLFIYRTWGWQVWVLGDLFFSPFNCVFFNRPLGIFPGNFEELSLMLFRAVAEPIPASQSCSTVVVLHILIHTSTCCAYDTWMSSSPGSQDTNTSRIVATPESLQISGSLTCYTVHMTNMIPRLISLQFVARFQPWLYCE